MHSRTNAVVFWTLSCLFATIVAAGGKQKSQTDFNTNVGVFRVPLHDDRLKAARQNHSLLVNATSTWSAVLNFWTSYGEIPFPDNETEYRVIKGNSSRHLNESLVDMLFNNTETEMKTYFENNPETEHNGSYDLTSFYLDSLFNYTASISYWNRNYLMGVGWTVDCSDHVDDILGNKAEWEKLGSSAASTLMALIPTILTFGNLYVPRSSELFATSSLVGLSTAFFSLGLPVASLGTIKGRRKIDVSGFSLAIVSMIASFAKRNKSGNSDDEIKTLQSWTEDDDSHEKQQFVDLKQQVGRWRDRWHWWQIPALSIAIAQCLMFGLAIAPLLSKQGVSTFIFDCHFTPRYTGLYLAVSAGANAIVRFLLWEIGEHERVTMWSLSDESKEAIWRIIDKNGPSIATDLPPMYRTALASTIRTVHHVRLFLLPIVSCGRLKGKKDHDMSQLKAGSVFHAIRQGFRELWNHTIYPIRHICHLVAGGPRNPVAPRFRPLIALVHLSTGGRSVFRTLFTGFIEAALLIILTFFFAAQWGGNLIITMYAMCLLLVFVTAGRVLGFIYLHISSSAWDLHVIHCDDKDQVRGCLRILCAMNDVLVEVNGATYFAGYRIDVLDGFLEFKKAYNAGQLDGSSSVNHDGTTSSQSSETLRSGSPSQV